MRQPVFSTVLSYTKSFVQALLVFIIIACIVDWVRKPAQPLDSAELPLLTLEQKHTTLAQISRNQTAVLYFWGSWCGFCRYTSPTVEKLHQEGVPVLSIAVKSGSPQVLQAYLKKHNLNFPTINDSDGLIAAHWQISATPTVILVKNGRMLHATTGLSSYWGLRSRIFLSGLAD